MELNQLIAEDHQVTCSAITSEELIANPKLVRTMSVQPPTDVGSIRVIGISDVDLQPCGGTHVKTTAEIGRVRIGKVENKGKHNRRINVHLEE
jgi:misacylated tRNA(Ala) deacylase